MMKKQMAFHCTAGAWDLALLTIRSPLKQILASQLMISPAGLGWHQNTQVHGTICSCFASDFKHSVHAPFFSSFLISFDAAAGHSFESLQCLCTSSQQNVRIFLTHCLEHLRKLMQRQFVELGWAFDCVRRQFSLDFAINSA